MSTKIPDIPPVGDSPELVRIINDRLRRLDSAIAEAGAAAAGTGDGGGGGAGRTFPRPSLTELDQRHRLVDGVPMVTVWVNWIPPASTQFKALRPRIEKYDRADPLQEVTLGESALDESLAATDRGLIDCGRIEYSNDQKDALGRIWTALPEQEDVTTREPWRIYLSPITANGEEPFKPFGVLGASVSAVIWIEPEVAGVGEEYAPNPRLPLAIVAYRFFEARWEWRVTLTWTEPPAEEYADRIATYGGAAVIVVEPDGDKLAAERIPRYTTTWTSEWRTAPAADETWKAWLPGYAVDGGRVNELNPSITPQVPWDVSPQPLGDVTGFSVAQSYEVNPHTGQPALTFTPAFTPPADPSYSHIEFWAHVIPTDHWVVLGWPWEGGPTAKAWVEEEFWPAAPESWEFYAVSVDRNQHARGDPRVDGEAAGPRYGPITVGAPPVSPNVSAFTVAWNYRLNGDGQKVLINTPNFTPPAGANWSYIEFRAWIDGVSYHLGNPTKSGDEALITDFPIVNEQWYWTATSVDSNGKRAPTSVRYPASGFVTVTPPPPGTAGQEYAPLVSGVAGLIHKLLTTDGIETYGFTLSFTLPASDPRYGGCKLVAVQTIEFRVIVLGYTGPTDTYLHTDFWPLRAPVNFDIYFVSYDVNNRENNIVAGVTPKVEDLALSPSATGTIDGGRLDEGSLGDSLTTSGGTLLEVAPYGIEAEHIAPGALDDIAKFSATVRPIIIVSGLPALPNANYPIGQLIYSTATGLLYRNVAGLWREAVQTGDLAPASVTTNHIATVGLSAIVIKTGTLTVGGAGVGAFIDIRDAVGTNIGWIGINGGDYGAWFPRIAIGGTGFADAYMKVLNNQLTFAVPASAGGTGILTIAQGVWDPSYSSVGVRIHYGGAPAAGSDTAWLISRGLVVYGSGNGLGNYNAVACVRSPTSSASGEVVVYGPTTAIIHLSGSNSIVRADGGFMVGGSVGINATIGYVKSAGGNGTLTFTKGILTAAV
jgi:hypothetical protein